MWTIGVIILVFALCFFWGPLLKPFRWLWRTLNVALKTSGVGRVPGALYCPDCAAPLDDGPAEHALSHCLCPKCSGAWFKEAALFEGFERLAKPKASWFLDEKHEGGALPCPKCSSRMQGGAFLGHAFTVHRCPSCSGYWMARMGWLSFELDFGLNAGPR